MKHGPTSVVFDGANRDEVYRLPIGTNYEKAVKPMRMLSIMDLPTAMRCSTLPSWT